MHEGGIMPNRKFKYILIAFAAITAVYISGYSCSVYKSPAFLERKDIIKVKVNLSKNDSTMRIMQNSDSLDILFKALNYNENIEYQTDTTYKILFIREIKRDETYDTTKIYFSVRGDEYSFYNIRKNPYGKILSKGTEYFRISKSMTEFLMGAPQTK
jgi:hypothetical protein